MDNNIVNVYTFISFKILIKFTHKIYIKSVSREFDDKVSCFRIFVQGNMPPNNTEFTR